MTKTPNSRVFRVKEEERHSTVLQIADVEISSNLSVKRVMERAMATNESQVKPYCRMSSGRSWRVLYWRSILERPKPVSSGLASGVARSLGPRRICMRPGGGAFSQALAKLCFAFAFILVFAGCQELPPPPKLTEADVLETPEYAIAPLDTIQIFVWRAPDLSVTVPVRPDGRITIPLVEDLVAAGKSPTVLARDIEEALRPFVQDPKASVVVENFANQTTQMVKVIGEVARPVTVHYQMHMSVLDAMAEAQGLTEYADGNDAKLIRKVNGRERTYQLKLNDLLHDGRMSANAKLRPGDLIVVPKSLL